jgi:hypothetical protein
MSSFQTFQTLREEQGSTSIEALNQLFDSLPAVSSDFMIGDWQGGVFNTGHPGEKQLHVIKWVGKAFRGPEDVDPIISVDDAGKRYANPVMGSARLRQVEYRGVMTASMVYDKHAIIDHFRHLNESTVLGVMDRKGEDSPLYFYLERL